MILIMELPDQFSNIGPLRTMLQSFVPPTGGTWMPGSRDVTVEVTVNGTRRVAEVPARTLLVHFLRDQLRLTGTHVGCDTTQCGACTVLVDGRSTKSCTLFAVQADGSTIT